MFTKNHVAVAVVVKLMRNKFSGRKIVKIRDTFKKVGIAGYFVTSYQTGPPLTKLAQEYVHVPLKLG